MSVTVTIAVVPVPPLADEREIDKEKETDRKTDRKEERQTER